MAQQKKHPSPAKSATHTAQSAARIASNTANKAAAAAMSAAETVRSNAESMMKFSTDTMKDAFASSADEAQKAHEKLYAIGRESSENFSRAIEAYTRTLNDMVGLVRENADAAAEVGNITADIAKSISAELVNCANSNFSDNVEIAKEAIACRNINDMFDVHSKFLSTNIDNFFAQTSRLAEMSFQLATEAVEPINERVAEATERLSKSLAA